MVNSTDKYLEIGVDMIFNFRDYRKFLNGYIKSLPKQGFGEAKRIAEYLNVSSTFISHILNSSKDLNLEQAITLAQYLGLSPLEADYFFYLVQWERAGNQELKKFCDKKLLELKQKSLKLSNRLEAKKVLSEEEKSIFYSAPIYSMVHIYCSTHKSGRGLDEISKRFNIPRAKASEVVRFLLDTNLCIELKDKFLTGTQSTHLEQGSPYLLKHHTNWRLRAIQSAENFDDSELMYTLNIAVSEKDFNLFREEMVQFIKKFLEKAYPSPAEEVACLNLDWFRIKT